jgi:hypothetical protein
MVMVPLSSPTALFLENTVDCIEIKGLAVRFEVALKSVMNSAPPQFWANKAAVGTSLTAALKRQTLLGGLTGKPTRVTIRLPTAEFSEKTQLWTVKVLLTLLPPKTAMAPPFAKSHCQDISIIHMPTSLEAKDGEVELLATPHRRHVT